MNSYDNYIPSRIDWIGDIPENWVIKRFKQNFYIKGRIGWQELRADEFSDEGIHCITGTDFIDGKVNWESCYRVSEERYKFDENIQLKEDDLLITKDGTIGKVALVKNLPEKATLNSGIFLIRPMKKRFLNDYLYWILNSSILTDFNDYTKTGTTINHLYQNVFERMHITVPSLDEQKEIARYLYEETQIIDSLISNKKSQIEKLKELRQIEINNAVTKGLNPNVEKKESGVEWLRKIPKHWVVKRIKNVSNFIKTGSTPSTQIDEYYDNGTIPWFGPSSFNSSIEMKESVKEISSFAIEKGEAILFPSNAILFVGIGATIGKSGIFRSNFSCNQQINVIKFKKIIYPDYAAFFMKIYESIIIKIANFATLPIFNQSNTANLDFLIPTIEEQKQIAEYLHQKTSTLTKVIENLASQIQKLEELRKIKIYEAVTGKVFIPPTDITNAGKVA